jgi:O-antigen biosynthesis protein
LKSRGRKSASEQTKQEQMLRTLTAEFRERAERELNAFWLAAHLAPLQRAKISAEVLKFRVPPSHRPTIGRYVSLVKRAYVRGLHPFHLELLRSQRNFNLRLLEVLETMIATRDLNPATLPPSDLRKTLGPLADPNRSDWASHRGPGLGVAIRIVKVLYLGVARRFLRQVLEQQRRWNMAALEALEAVCSTDQPQPTCALVERLSREADLMGPDRRQGLGITAPLWQEVFRRQIDFNQAASTAIAELLGAQPPPLRRSTIGYQKWIAEREQIEISRTSRAIRRLHQAPRFRVIVIPATDSDADLSACVTSVKRQLYRGWELCLARAINSETSTSNADFIVLLSPTQRLAPHGLAELALWIHAHPDVDVLYSDEDEVDHLGYRTQPFFKPGWSPDLLRCCNYFGRLLVIRRSLLQGMGLPDHDLGGDPFFNLALRATEHARVVGHVPRILHHRTPGRSVSSEGSIAALSEHLKRTGEMAEIEPTSSGSFHLKYPVSGNPLVSIIVPFKDKPDLLGKLVETLISVTRYQNYELLLISNNSIKDETFGLLERLDSPKVRKLQWDHPFNYSSINNFGVAQARGTILLFLNNDIEVCEAEWLEELLGHAQRPQIGAVGPKLLYPNGTIQHAGVVLGINGFAGHVFSGLSDGTTPFGRPDWVRNYLAVTGACLMTRKETFLEVGGFDEHFEVVGGDIDLCLRIVRSGKRIVYTPHAKLVHYEAASRKFTPVPYRDAWMSFLAYQPWLRDGDPFYNPNLTLLGIDGSFREHGLSAEDLAMAALATQLEEPDQIGRTVRS